MCPRAAITIDETVIEKTDSSLTFVVSGGGADNLGPITCVKAADSTSPCMGFTTATPSPLTFVASGLNHSTGYKFTFDVYDSSSSLLNTEEAVGCTSEMFLGVH